MKKFDKSAVMKNAWVVFRKYAGTKNAVTFGEALHRAWNAAKAEPFNAGLIEAAKMEYGVDEEVKTWYGWKEAGYMVRHGEKRLFMVELVYATKGDGAMYKGSFFGRSQVEAVEAA